MITNIIHKSSTKKIRTCLRKKNITSTNLSKRKQICHEGDQIFYSSDFYTECLYIE